MCQKSSTIGQPQIWLSCQRSSKDVCKQLINFLVKDNLLLKYPLSYWQNHATDCCFENYFRCTLCSRKRSDASRDVRHVSCIWYSWPWHPLGKTLIVVRQMEQLCHGLPLSFKTECKPSSLIAKGPSSVTSCVPQGSILGPILCLLYMFNVELIAKKHGINFSCCVNVLEL